MDATLLALTFLVPVPIETATVTVECIEFNDSKSLGRPQIVFWGWEREKDGSYTVINHGWVIGDDLAAPRLENGWFVWEHEFTANRRCRPVLFRVRSKRLVHSTTVRDPEADSRTQGWAVCQSIIP